MKKILVAAVPLLLLAACETPHSAASTTMTAPTGAAAASTSQCHARGVLPDPTCTPGAANPNVTQATIGSTICVSGWTKKIRPPTSYTNKLEVQQIVAYGYTDTDPSHYEEDHHISLELGGDPRDPRNLWPEPYSTSPGAKVKDRIENKLHILVCDGRLPLVDAQHAIAADWTAAYRKYVGPL